MVTLALFFAAVIALGCVLKGLELYLSVPKSIDYDTRWGRTKYVKMVHKTRELEKENLGKIITECHCRVCMARAEIEKKKAQLREQLQPKSSIELQKPTYYPARNCLSCGISYQSGDISLCGSCRRAEQFRSTSPLPDDVPAHAHAQHAYDPMLLSDVVYWTWIDRDTGHKMGVRQIVPPALTAGEITLNTEGVKVGDNPKVLTPGEPKESFLEALESLGHVVPVVPAHSPNHTGPFYDEQGFWNACACAECDPVIRQTRRTLRDSLVKRLA